MLKSIKDKVRTFLGIGMATAFVTSLLVLSETADVWGGHG
jgi:hypothetical protein